MQEENYLRVEDDKEKFDMDEIEMKLFDKVIEECTQEKFDQEEV